MITALIGLAVVAAIVQIAREEYRDRPGRLKG